MKWDDLVDVVKELPWFDLPLLRTMFPEDRESVVVYLYRWRKNGKIFELRRGLYSLADRYRKETLNPASVAGAMYPPSYLSLEWALSWYGIIPEKTVRFTSVSTRETRKFSNTLGVFSYRTVKPKLFFGYETRTILNAPVLLALPEKALCDFWYLTPGTWNADRMESFRFDPESSGSDSRMEETVKSFGSARMDAAFRAWREYGERAKRCGWKSIQIF